MRNNYRDDIIRYAHILRATLEKSESTTSHLFISGIYHASGIDPINLLPQSEFASGSRRGLIDYVYMSPASIDLHAFIELKKYNSIIRESDHMKQVLTYLKASFPPDLLKLKREDNWRLGILTDLRTTYLYLRKRQWGSTSQVYSLPRWTTNELSELPNFFKELGILLNLPNGKLCSKFFWEDIRNRFQILSLALLDDTSQLFRVGYGLWLKELGSAGGRGWPGRFRDTFAAACDSSKHTSSIAFPEVDAIKWAFNAREVRREVKNHFQRSYDVDFGKGNDPLVFKKKFPSNI